MQQKKFVIDGDEILVEIEDPQSDTSNFSRDSEESFEPAFEKIRKFGSLLQSKLAQMETKPKEASIEIGIKISAEGGIIIAKGSTEAHLKVKLTW